MHEQICNALLEAKTRLIYYTSPTFTRILNSLKEEHSFFYHEITTDEKTAFELGLAGAIASKRTACLFSTEEVFETIDPIMTSAYTGVKGGYLIICVKDTPHNISFIGPFSKLPVIHWENGEDFFSTIEFCFNISEKYEIPVVLQVEIKEGLNEKGVKGIKRERVTENINEAHFIKDMGRWAATPSYRFKLHQALNKKIENIREEFEKYNGNKVTIKGKTGLITTKNEFMDFYDEDVSILKISTIFPLPEKLVERFIKQMEEVFIIEEEYPAIEIQIKDRKNTISEIIKIPSKIKKREESIYGFHVVRDWFGPASSINIAHGIKKTEPDKNILAITYENHFFHSGMPAFVNVLYNNSSFLLIITVSEREEEIKKFMEGCGFKNFFHMESVDALKDFKVKEGLTVIFFRGMI